MRTGLFVGWDFSKSVFERSTFSIKNHQRCVTGASRLSMIIPLYGRGYAFITNCLCVSRMGGSCTKKTEITVTENDEITFPFQPDLFLQPIWCYNKIEIIKIKHGIVLSCLCSKLLSLYPSSSVDLLNHHCDLIMES